MVIKINQYYHRGSILRLQLWGLCLFVLVLSCVSSGITSGSKNRHQKMTIDESKGKGRVSYYPVTNGKLKSGTEVIPKSSESRGYSSMEQDYPVHYATYQTRGGYNPLAIIAITVFGVLSLILLLQLLGVQSMFNSHQ